MRIAIFVDQVFWRDARGLSTDEAYILFLASLAEAAEEIILIGREAPMPGRASYALSGARISLHPLPFYPSLHQLWRSDLSLLARVRADVRRAAGRWDALLVCGPHPIGQLVARECIRLGIPVGLVVRQNIVRMMGTYRGAKRVLTVAAARIMEWHFKRLARGRTVFAVGGELAEVYRRHTDPHRVHDHFPCLVDDRQFEDLAATPAGSDATRLVWVGRLSVEKGLEYLFEAIALLGRRGLSCHLDVVGSGPLDQDLRARAAALGISGQLTFHGYVPYGPSLFDVYRQAGLMVLPSLSEGFPQVLNESLAAGLPTIASAVGGIPYALTHEQTALLVPPRDPESLAGAIARLVGDGALRERLRRGGRALMRANTLEANRARVMQAIRHELVDTQVRESREFRSAFEDYPKRPLPEQPSVAAIVPVYNEITNLPYLVADLLVQDYPRLDEIWFVDGGSNDGTAACLLGLPSRDRRVRVIDNPRRSPAAALNLAIPQSRTDIVIRLDAHARYGTDTVRRSVEALLATAAGGVGAIQRPEAARGLVARSIVAAHKSRFGLGGAKFREEGAEGWADSIWNGCYWRHVLDRVGPLREDLWRAEDNDFNARVRGLGYGLYVSPAIHAFYQPRRTLRALWSQYMSNGRGVAVAWFDNPRAFGLRHLAPLAFVSSAATLAATAAVWPQAWPGIAALLGAYACGLACATLAAARSERGAHVLLLPLVLGVLHVSYGLGSLRGLLAGVRRIASRIARSAGWSGRAGTAGLGVTAGLACGLAWLTASGTAVPTPVPSLPTASPGISIWLAPSMARIGRDDAPGTATSIRLYAGRREAQSFQVVVRAPSAARLSHVRVRIGDLAGENGTHLPAGITEMYREHYVYVSHPSPDLGGSNRPQGVGWYPDPLEPLPATRDVDRDGGPGGFDVEAGHNQPIWVDVTVPPDAPSGHYRAAVTVESDQGRTAGTLDLTVWDFALPAAPFLDSMFLQFGAKNPQVPAELLKHRLMPRNVRIADERRLIEQYGLKSVNLPFWSGATENLCRMTPAPDARAVRAAAAAHDPALRLYDYSADEIDACPQLIEPMRAWGRALHAAGVENLVTMSPTRELFDDGGGTGRSAVDVWVVLPSMYDRARKRVAEAMHKGDRVWSYNALVQDDYSPKWEIDFRPVDFRIVPGFISDVLGLTGVLYWAVDLWTGDPWRDVQTYRKGGNEYPGEGMLVYPGKQVGVAGVVPSMRLKWLRDGVQDYDYLRMLRQRGCDGAATASERLVATSWREWTKDPAVIEGAHTRLGQSIERVDKGEMRCVS